MEKFLLQNKQNLLISRICKNFSYIRRSSTRTNRKFDISKQKINIMTERFIYLLNIKLVEHIEETDSTA